MNPKHVAIIPDGNRRWAKEKGLPTIEGHRRGFDQAFKITKKARDLDIKILTLWAFSTENWKRSKQEVGYLMNIYSQMIDKYLQDALKDKVRIIHLGRKDRINKTLLRKISEAEAKTKSFNKYFLCIALDYGGQDEILRALKQVQILPAGRQGSKTKAQNLNEENFNNFLDTRDLPYPNVDLVIRTSGEARTSGFMLWQTSYSEYIFYPKHFPDFTPQEFEKCIKEYQSRKRRFGK